MSFLSFPFPADEQGTVRDDNGSNHTEKLDFLKKQNKCDFVKATEEQSHSVLQYDICDVNIPMNYVHDFSREQLYLTRLTLIYLSPCCQITKNCFFCCKAGALASLT